MRGEKPLVDAVEATVAAVDDDGPPPPVVMRPLTSPVDEGFAGIVIRLIPEVLAAFVTPATVVCCCSLRSCLSCNNWAVVVCCLCGDADFVPGELLLADCGVFW